jgi:hypothetical protein
MKVYGGSGCVDILRLKTTPSELQTSHDLKKNPAPKFALREWKCSEMKVVEEYCWTITQVMLWLPHHKCMVSWDRRRVLVR